MHREPDAGLDPRTPGSRPGPKAGAKPPSHPGIPPVFPLTDVLKSVRLEALYASQGLGGAPYPSWGWVSRGAERLRSLLEVTQLIGWCSQDLLSWELVLWASVGSAAGSRQGPAYRQVWAFLLFVVLPGGLVLRKGGDLTASLGHCLLGGLGRMLLAQLSLCMN